MLLTGMGQTRIRDDERTYHQQTFCVQVYEHASDKYIDIKERETWNAPQQRAGKQSHARECGTCVQ